MNRLNGKVALVTGAGGVIGRGICATLASEGAAIACVDLNEPSCRETVQLIEQAGGTARAYAVDITQRAAVHALVDQVDRDFGRLDTVVNNAMWVNYQPIAAVDEDTVDRMFGIGLKALMWMTQAAEPLLARQGGAIINVSSMAATRVTPNRMVYTTVKAGVEGLTRETAVELGPRGIRVNGIAPGLVLHEASARRMGPEAVEQRRQSTPLGRLALPDDMGRVVLFLASDDSQFVSGTTIPVDGGRWTAA
ncbi:MAG: SDR family oxidoreductase [Burkholderiales bacterium]